MKRTILRITGAFTITLWAGLVGALAGLGAFSLHPAQYRSTAIVVVGADKAADVLAAAQSPEMLSGAILTADLFHSERDAVPLDALVKRLPFTVTSIPANAGAATHFELSMTYVDPHSVRRALDSVVRHMMSEAPRP
jgi:hypothetical protein